MSNDIKISMYNSFKPSKPINVALRLMDELGLKHIREAERTTRLLEIRENLYYSNKDYRIISKMRDEEFANTYILRWKAVFQKIFENEKIKPEFFLLVNQNGKWVYKFYEYVISDAEGQATVERAKKEQGCENIQEHM